VNGGGTSNGADLTFTTLAAGNVCTPDAGVTSGMGPASSAVPCIQQGVAFTQTYTFVVPLTAAGGAVTVTSVHFDSIVNLPAGLTAAYKSNSSYLYGRKHWLLYYQRYHQCTLWSISNEGLCNYYYECFNSTRRDFRSCYNLRFTRIQQKLVTCNRSRRNLPSSKCFANCLLLLPVHAEWLFAITATATKTDVSCFGGKQWYRYSSTKRWNYLYLCMEQQRNYCYYRQLSCR